MSSAPLVTPLQVALRNTGVSEDTGFVPMENVALDDPAGTVWFAVNVTGPRADTITGMPPVGALKLKVNVAVEASPPKTGLGDTVKLVRLGGGAVKARSNAFPAEIATQ